MEPENPGLEIAKAFAGEVGKASVDKFADAIRNFVPFWGLRKKAVDTYVREIEQSDISPEAKMLAIANTKKKFRELENQSAIIDVAYSTLSLGGSSDNRALPDPDNELVSRLIDASKFVSDEDLQLLWGNVLAGEFERPGGTPKNVVRILSELSKENAVIFSNLASLQVDLLSDTGTDIVYNGSEIMVGEIRAYYLYDMKINFDKLYELEHLGLIDFASLGNYSRIISGTNCPYIHIVSNNEVITVYNRNGELPNGTIILTPAGKCISRFVEKHHNQEHMDTIRKYLEAKGTKVSPVPGIIITKVMKEPGKDPVYSWRRQPIEPQ